MLLNVEEYKEDVSSSAPWHVIKSCCVIVDLMALKCPDDLFVDGWNWSLSKSYVVSGSSKSEPFKNGNIDSHYRIVKRLYKCKTDVDIEKQVYLTYPPKVKATTRSGSIVDSAERYAVINFRFKGNKEKLVQPSEKSRVYPSVRNELRTLMKDGQTPKRATFNLTKSSGGLYNIKNASSIPKVTQAYEISRKHNIKTTDPLKLLIQKQQEDKKTGGGVIQKIHTNPFSYDIILFNDRIIKNIASFCCNDIQRFKSPLCFDFTFDLGKSPPFYALVVTYQNTSILHKQTQKCPTMLGPLVLCHKKDEVHVKMLCDILIEKCPGLKNSIKVIGSDCEKSISNETCVAFPSAILLLCTKHVEDNVRRNLPNVLSEKKKEEILADIFGTKVVKGLIDALDIDEFNAKLADLHTK